MSGSAVEIAAKVKYASVEDFVSQQLNLLNLERDAEIAESRKLQETISAKQLQEKGVCIVGLGLQNIRSGLYGRTIATFCNKLVDKELPATKLGTGDIVGIFLNSSGTQSEKDQLCSGIISCVKSCVIDVALDVDTENLDLDESGCYKLLKLANNVTYRRLKEGLNDLKNYQGPAAPLINAIFGGLPFSTAALSLPPLLLDHERNIVWSNASLDESQRQAVEFALRQREVAVVHGPPGTGKTTTVVEIIHQAVKSGDKVLACAPSNVAVDNMLEKLVSSNSSVKAVRLGHPTRMHESIQNRSLDAVLSASDARSIVNDVRRDLDAQLKLISRSKRQGAVFNEIKSLRKELRERETKAVKEILGHANVVLATLTSATQDGPLKHLPVDHFDYVVIDECSQATEAACWLALRLAPRALLAGDHLQLPPTILSPEAERKGLSLTLMERILGREDGHSVVRMLTTQYRMHRDIMQWASERLYHGKLVAHSSVGDHLLCQLPGVEENEDTVAALLLIDTAGCDLYESAVSDEGSKANSGEAALVALHARRLIESGVPARDIAIVTPYNLQVELLRQMLGGDHPEMEIRSVDGFQGREKEAIILSLVRSNSTGQVGFVADVRRLNVACTRARRHLCLVTDSSTTSRAASGLVEYMAKVGEVRTAHQYQQEMDAIVVPESSGKTATAARPKTLPSVQSLAPNDSREKDEAASKIKAVLVAWSQSGDAIKEFPSTLTAFERMVVHQWAEENGFEHRSVGEKRERRICVRKTAPKEDQPIANTVPEESLLVEKPQAPSSAVPEESAPEADDADESGKTNLTGAKSKTKHRKKKAPKETETTIKSEKPAVPAVDLIPCPNCEKLMPRQNLTLHQLRCQVASKSESAPTAVRPKQKPLVKALPKVVGRADSEDVDSILSEFRQVDHVCNYTSCKTSITLFGQQCSHCLRRFCLSHHMAEVHGCGDAARRQARAVTHKQGFLSAGSGPVKPKAVDPAKRCHLQRKLDKKIQDLTTKRTGPQDSDKKKKS